MQFLIKSTPQAARLIFNAIKAKILKHLERLEKEEAESVQKAFSELTGLMMKGGKGLPVGTIREWKGKKFIKIAPGKWKPKYESHSRGAKLAIAALKKKIAACDDPREMMHLVLENRDRFSDANGNPLPFVQELSSFIEQTQDTKGKKAQTGSKRSEAANTQTGKTEIEQLLAAVNPDGGNKRGFQFILKDAQHLKDIKRIIDDFEKNPPKESERDQLKSYVRQHEKERKRFQALYNKEGDNAALALAHKHADLMNLYNWQLTKLDEKHTSPASSDGYPEKDYPEYKGKGQKAVDFIAKQQGGQVRGAFNRPEIGDIDVVWGKVTNAEKHEGYGLAHIIDKHGLEAVKKIGDAIKSGEFITEKTGRTGIKTDTFRIGLKKEWFGNKKTWIVTSYELTKGSDKFIRSTDNNTGETLPATSPKSVPQSGKKSSAFELDGNKKNETAVNVPGYAYSDAMGSVNYRSYEEAISFLEEKIAEVSENIEKYSFYKNDSRYVDSLSAYKKILAEFTKDKSIWAKAHIKRRKKDIERNNEHIESLKNSIESYKKKLLAVEKAPSDSRFKIDREKTLHTKQYTIKYYKEWIDNFQFYIQDYEEKNAEYKKGIKSAEAVINNNKSTENASLHKSIAELEAAFESFQKSRTSGALSLEPVKPFVRQKGVKYVLIAKSPCSLLDANKVTHA